MDEKLDLSNAVEQLQQMFSSDEGKNQIADIVKMFSGENSNEKTDTAPSPMFGDSGGMDMETVLKISGLIQAMNSGSNNEKTVFLNALKPFLRESRRTRLDHAAKLMNMISVMKTFTNNNAGGD